MSSVASSEQHLARRIAEPSAVPRADQLSEVGPRLLRCFVAVAEEQHFGRAADRLYVAQPALSRSIQRLERILGRTLFVRTTRSVELTASGSRLLPAARDVLASLDDLTTGLVAEPGVVRVAHVPCADTVAIVLDELQRVRPSMRVEEHVLGGAEQLAALRDGVIDVAVCPGSTSPASGLRAELLRLDPLLVAVIDRDPARAHPVNPSRRTVAVADYGPDDPAWSATVRAYEERTGCALRRVRVASGSGTEAHTMRRAGALAFLTPSSRAVHLDQPCPTFGAVPVQGYLPWSLTWRAGRRSAALQSFLDTARDVARQRAWHNVSDLLGEPWVEGEAAWGIAA